MVIYCYRYILFYPGIFTDNIFGTWILFLELPFFSSRIRKVVLFSSETGQWHLLVQGDQTTSPAGPRSRGAASVCYWGPAGARSTRLFTFRRTQFSQGVPEFKLEIESRVYFSSTLAYTPNGFILSLFSVILLILFPWLIGGSVTLYETDAIWFCALCENKKYLLGCLWLPYMYHIW